MRWRRGGPWRRFARRVGVVFALAAYLVAAIGFPIPATASPRRGAYPCSDLPCGCESAEACWSGCCCLTVEERWAWAREHNVEPPPYAERPSAKKSDSLPRCANCEPEPAAKPRPCCMKGSTAASSGGVRWVVGMRALGCRGQATVWIASGAVTAPPAALEWQPFAPPAEWLSPAHETPLGMGLVPPDPPPRCTHS